MAWEMPNTWQNPGFFGSGGTGNPGSLGPNSLSDPGAMSVPQMGAGIGAISSPAGMAGAGGGMGLGAGLGMNIGTGQLALGGLSALGNLWTGFNAAGLAKKQFDFTSRIADTNLRNQTAAYNTTLDDRARVRGVMEGQSSEQVEDYKNRNRLRA